MFEIEAAGLAHVASQLDDGFATVVEKVVSSSGRVVVCGMGKSGHIARKISATLASTGTPSFFMHPAEAFHGDLGMVHSSDVFLGISYSGETEEIVNLLPFLRANGNVVIGFTGNPSSTLARAADNHLSISVQREACPLQLAPTSSTTAALVLGDSLAVALMEVRQFRPENFARFHPGGALGRKLLSSVRDEMVSGELPVLGPAAPMSTVVSSLSEGRLGLVIVNLEPQDGWGIITDGDLRRAMELSGRDAFDLVARDMMSRDPFSVSVDAKMADALEKMEREGVSALLVLDEAGCLVGLVRK